MESAEGELVRNIYDSVFDRNVWQQVLPLIAEYLGSLAAVLSQNEAVGSHAILHAHYGFDPYWCEQYTSKYHLLDPVDKVPHTFGIDDPLRSVDLISEADLHASSYFREYRRPQGFEHAMGVAVVRDAATTADLWLLGQRAYCERSAASLTRLSPHIRRALTIAALIQKTVGDRNTFASIVDQLSTPVIFVDPSTRVQYANPAAEAVLERGDIVRVTSRGLDVVAPSKQAGFRRALLAPGSTRTRLPLDMGNHSEALATILPLENGRRADLANARNAVTAVFLHDSAGSTIPVDLLGRFFKLTNAEIRVLRCLLNGKSLSEIASEASLSVTTIRWHVKNLFAKTGTSRQSELIRKVMNTLPPANRTNRSQSFP